MSEELVVIEGFLREKTGKEYCRKLRKAERIPANILDNAKATKIELNYKNLSKAWKNGKQFSLLMNGESKTVRIHELQINPVKRTPIHVDLMYV